MCPDADDRWPGGASHSALLQELRHTNIGAREDLTIAKVRGAHSLLDTMDGVFDDELGSDVGPLIHPSAQVHPTSVLGRSVVVGPQCVIGPHCYLRSYVLLTRGVVLGFGVELDRAILHDGVKIAHTSCTGRSAVGERSNLGYGFVTATRRLDQRPVRVPLSTSIATDGGQFYLSTATHHGSVIGADVVCGVNVSLMPGVTVMPGSVLGPNVSLRGMVVSG